MVYYVTYHTNEQLNRTRITRSVPGNMHSAFKATEADAVAEAMRLKMLGMTPVEIRKHVPYNPDVAEDIFFEVVKRFV